MTRRCDEFLSMLAVESDACVVWPHAVDGFGYGKFWFAGRQVRAHRLSLQLSSGCDGVGLYAAHGPCHRPACFNPRHLSWKSNRDNQLDRRRDGTMAEGEAHHHARLSDADVRRLAELVTVEGWTQRAAGELFGVSRAYVGNVVNGRVRVSAFA